MAVKFNPFTGQLQIDEKGSGGGSAFFAGEVATYADLPLDGTAALNSRWLVRSNSGTWPFSSYKQAGIYIRTATGGTDRDADYTLTDTSFHDVMSDDAFLIFDNTDPTKAAKFDVGANVSAGQTRTLSIPNSSGTIQLTGHAAAHASAGSDPLAPSDIGAAASNHTHILATDIATALAEDPDLCRDSLNLGDMATESSSLYALADHTHGNLTNDGKLGSTAGLPVVTTTAGAVTTLALGTANQVLRVNSGATGVEFADPAASGVSSVASSASDVLGVSGSDITGVDANADRIIFFDDSAGKLTHLTVGSGLSISDTTISATGGGVTTGSVDNAIIRADGTGGSTSQSSDINIEDATTSTENNVQISNQHSGQTNSSLVLSPKGTGAFILGPRPTGAASTGNARGANAVDLQMARNAATQVASGATSFIGGGTRNTASAEDTVVCGGRENVASSNFASAFPSAVCGGYQNTASSFSSFVGGGRQNTASGSRSMIAAGEANTASAYGTAILGGFNALANRYGIVAHANGQFAAQGDAQRVRILLRNKTTTNSAVELFADGGAGERFTIPSGKVVAMIINITGVRSTGGEVAHYVRQYCLKNVAGTTSEVYAAITIGTDTAAGTSIVLSANDTNDALKIDVTGVASQTWRWVASVDAVEVAYGT